jgi:hypothetical protein
LILMLKRVIIKYIEIGERVFVSKEWLNGGRILAKNFMGRFDE